MTLAQTVLLVRPASFGPDEETRASNAFQSGQFAVGSCLAAQSEVDALAGALTAAGVETLVLEETTDALRPNAVFPNNWLSTHPDGTVVLYPMQAPNRRLERGMPALARLEELFKVRRVLDMTRNEVDGKFLEGTGSLVLDHDARLAFACASPRTDPGLVNEWCQEFGFEPMLFSATGPDGKAVYHTNVVMAVGEGFAAFGSSLVPEHDRAKVHEALGSRVLIDLEPTQIDDFAGNMLALRAADGSQVVTLSTRAWESLTPVQQASLGDLAHVVAVPLPTIEQSGGSARCMLAEVFLPRLQPR